MPSQFTFLTRIARRLLGADRRRRIRIAQWLISLLVYASTVLVMRFGVFRDPGQQEALLSWTCFVGIGQGLFYLALRSGWSERFADPALTSAQIVFGVLCVEFGYLICGPIRSVALMPLLLIFAFGAFSLSWRRIVELTAFALASLVMTMLILHATRDGGRLTLDNVEVRIDATNLLMVGILLPALSVVAARLSALRSRLRSQREALSAALGEVERLATHDELTGLANRRSAQARLAEELQRHVRTRHAFSVAIIDLDKFKSINDRLGHAGGDDVLKSFSIAAAASLRACDLLARWGGEEFLVLFPDTTGTEAQASLGRVLERVHDMPHVDGHPLSFSAGVAECAVDESLADLVSRADHAMYAAKHLGRDRILLADAPHVAASRVADDEATV